MTWQVTNYYGTKPTQLSIIHDTLHPRSGLSSNGQSNVHLVDNFRLANLMSVIELFLHIVGGMALGYWNNSIHTAHRMMGSVSSASKFKPPNVLGYPAGDLDHEEIQRRKNHQSSTGGGKRHHGPGFLQETPDHRIDFLSLAEQIRQHDGVGSSTSEGVGA